FGVEYTDTGDQAGNQRGESVQIATSDRDNAILTVPVSIEVVERLRVVPRSLVLGGASDESHSSSRVIVSDSLGEKVSIQAVRTSDAVTAEFSKDPALVQSIWFRLRSDPVDPALFPATVWIDTKAPCQASVPITIHLESSGR